MHTVSYKSHGVPLETYELTSRDHNSQRTSEQIRDHVAGLASQWPAEEDADPALRVARQARVQEVWDRFLSVPTPDHQLMRWRVRLYCGHITETRRHCESAEPRAHGSSSMRCPECQRDPCYIVAYEPLGLVAETPGRTVPPTPPRPTRAQLERRVRELEAELAGLRREMAPGE